jgi:uncharacterized protein YqeY
MDLKTKIQDDMKTAMKAGDPVKLGAIRMLYSEVKKREIDKRSPLDEGEIQKTVQSMIKQRNDSIEAFTKGNRPELADKEKAEIEVLKVYLPAMMSPAEVEALVVAAIKETEAKTPNDIGKVMKAVIAKAAGKADGKLVNEIARAKLAGS